MEWLLGRSDPYQYLASAVLVLCCVLLLSSYFYNKPRNRSVLAWGSAFAVFSLQPIIQLLAAVSAFLACCMVLVIHLAGSCFLIAGLLLQMKNHGYRRLTAWVLVASTGVAAVLLPVCLQSNAVSQWLASVFLLQFGLLATGLLLFVLSDRLARNIPICFSLFLLAAGSAYFAVSLLLNGRIGGYSVVMMLNFLLLTVAITNMLAARYAAQAELGKQRSELLLSATGAYEYSFDGDMFVSAKLFRALGYKFTNISRSKLKGIIHLQDLDEFNSVIQLGSDSNNTPSSKEVRLKDSEGNFIWFRLSGSNVNIDGATLIVGIALNIDQLKRIEECAMQGDRLIAVGRLTNGVAHDINNQLMTIQTALTALNSTADELHQKKYQSYMRDAITNCSNVLKRLVSFSRGDGEVRDPVLMNTLLSMTRGLLEQSMGNDVALTFACDASNDSVLGNYYELQNVIMNIALNARDALQKTGGGIWIRTWNADVNPLRRGDTQVWYYISIRDNGCGMPVAIREKIFQPFFTTKPNGRGNGLGLYSVNACVNRYGGTISVESVMGKGTEFVLAFPLYSESTSLNQNQMVEKPS